MMKAATVVVAATHHHRCWPAACQLVSSTFWTAASLTAVSAAAWAGAQAVLTSRSHAALVPRAMGTAKTSALISSAARLGSWWRPVR
jgi:hypothetical protein